MSYASIVRMGCYSSQGQWTMDSASENVSEVNLPFLKQQQQQQKDMRKGESWSAIGRSMNWYSYCGNPCGDSRAPGDIPQKGTISYYRDPLHPLFIDALFTMVQTCEQASQLAIKWWKIVVKQHMYTMRFFLSCIERWNLKETEWSCKYYREWGKLF